MTGVGFATVLSALLIVLTVPIASAQTRTPLVSTEYAKVYRINLPPHTRETVTPTTRQGLAWVAITDGIVVSGSAPKLVESGAADWQEDPAPIQFRARDAGAAEFVVVDLLAHPLGAYCSANTWGVGIGNWGSPFWMKLSEPNYRTTARTLRRNESLEPGKTIDEVHGEGGLFVAVAPLALKIQANHAGEGEPARMADPTILKLAAGEVRWTKPATQLITNVGKTNARFVRVSCWCR